MNEPPLARLNRLQLILNEAEVHLIKHIEKGFVAAGRRARKSLRHLRDEAEALRKDLVQLDKQWRGEHD